MSDAPRIEYRALPDATPETDRSTLGNVYRFILDRHAEKQGARPAARDDAQGHQPGHAGVGGAR